MLNFNLKVTDEKSKKFFLFCLPIYKSFILKPVKWHLDSPYDDIKDIEKALNIKKRKERIAYIFDTTCKRVDDHFQSIENPCGFLNGQCYSQRCRKVKDKNGCCRLCQYQSPLGCTTKNLACKLFFCSEVRKRYKIIEFKEINILKMLSIRQKLLVKSDYFSKREDVINDLYYGSLILGTIRIYIRILGQLLENHKKV